MIFVMTEGGGSMDRYSQKLARHLQVPKLNTDIYQKVAKLFNIPFFSQQALKSIWEDVKFIKLLRRLNDAVHLPNQHLGRYGLFLRQPYVITVHDLIRYFDLRGFSLFIHRPNQRDRLYLWLDCQGIKHAAAIIAVSKTTKRDLMEHLGIEEDRIFVVYGGIDHTLFRRVERRPIEEPYILYVGSEQPRKNLITLLQALKLLKEGHHRFHDLKLVKVGLAGGREAPFRRYTLEAIAALGLERNVIFTEMIPDEDLPAYYSGAEAYVSPSLYEGFCFPLLEAMACGCPVIATNAGSQPEVAGDAALVVEPRDPVALARALQEVLTEEGLRWDLIARGLAWAAQFSWEKAAREMETVYAFLKGNRNTLPAFARRDI